MIKGIEEYESVSELFNYYLQSLRFREGGFILCDFGFVLSCFNLRFIVEELTLKPVTSQVFFLPFPS
jgi:hypothetical protein